MASGVPKERIFCIPGNHDIDRERQKFCFRGAREILQDENRVDALLAGGEDLEALLKRQESYRKFQNTYFGTQKRKWIASGLAYVSHLTIDDIRLAIIGFDSAWLANGGLDDHGQLVIGERQVIDAINLAQDGNDSPHVVIGMAHHPFHLLREFDRFPVQNHIESGCHFFHCGHLHEPEARSTARLTMDCLTLAGGASFETRQSVNTHSIITLDLFRASRVVNTIKYNPKTSSFSAMEPENYPIAIASPHTCTLEELSGALQSYSSKLAPYSHYLAALLLDRKAELPIPAGKGYTFGSFPVSQSQPDTDLRRKTAAFMTFRNVLRVLYKRMPLHEMLKKHGVVVAEYGDALIPLAAANPDLQIRLAANDKDARLLGEAEPSRPSTFARDLLAELADAGDWPMLRDQAQRHVNSPDKATARNAKRMLALSLAKSHEMADKESAVELYESLTKEDLLNVSDIGNLAVVLVEMGRADDAKAIILSGLGTHSVNQNLFEIGQRIVDSTGDKDFRKQLEMRRGERGQRG